MAAPTAANVRVGLPLATGAVLAGPSGTAVPTSANAAPNVALLADYFHMARVGERMDEIARVGGVAHAHIATRGTRGFPHLDDGEEIPAFLAQLRACGCDHCSVESCGNPDVAGESPHSLAYLRRAWNALPATETK